MLLGCGGNDTSSFVDDESARAAGTYVDSQKGHCRFARRGPIGSLRRGAIYFNVYVNDRYVTTCLPDYKGTWNVPGFPFMLYAKFLCAYTIA